MNRRMDARARACLVALAAGTLPTLAAAQSNVTIYGLLDLGVEHLTKVAGGGSLTRMPSLTGTVPSRLGFRGEENLGGGLKAVFVLESGLLPDSGGLNQGGRMFGRQSFVGLAGQWGRVMVGRQHTALLMGLQDSDAMGANTYGVATLDSYLANARADNALGYVGSFGAVTVGGTYSLGRDAVNAGPSPGGTNCAGESATDSKACREWSLGVQYRSDTWGIAAAADSLRGGPGAFAGLTSSTFKDRRVIGSGYVKFGATKLGFGLIRRENDGNVATPRTGLAYLNVSTPVGSGVILDLQAQQLRFRGSANKATLLSARATYALSKRTAVYLQSGHIANDGTLALSASAGQPGSGAPSAGGSQLGVMAGIRHAF